MSAILNRIFLAAICCLLMSSLAECAMRAGPKIVSVEIDADHPDVVCIYFQSAPCKVALSTNGGQTFQPIGEREIPADLTTTLSSGSRRYVLAGATFLFRSDDGGATWKKTESSSFIHSLIDERIEQAKQEFWDEYGCRLPSRSILWHPSFGLFAVGYFLLTLFVLREQGWFKPIWTGLRGAAVMLLVWCFMTGFHAAVMKLTASQYPLAYWISTAYQWPSPKLGLAMAIAARPLPLLAYLVTLWPLLPGSLNVVDAWMCSQSPLRQRLARALAIAAGCLFVVGHGCLLSIGYFWEST